MTCKVDVILYNGVCEYDYVIVQKILVVQCYREIVQFYWRFQWENGFF